MNKSQSQISSLNYENLVSLHKEQKILSYKQLCSELNIPVLTSNSKSKQLKELSSICTYTKFGTKYRIDEICSNEELMLFNNRSIYLPYIELILTSLFNKSSYGEDIVYLSTMEILLNCGMVNNNYKISRFTNWRNRVEICETHNFDIDEFDTFLNITYKSVFKPIVQSALLSMENRKSISLNKGFKLYKQIGDFKQYKKVSEFDTQGKILCQIEADAFTELDIKNKSALHINKNLQYKYYKLCNEKCRHHPNLGFDGFYHCHAIIINKERMNYNVLQLKKELNQKIQKRLLDSKSLASIQKLSMQLFLNSTIDLNPPSAFKEK